MIGSLFLVVSLVVSEYHLNNNSITPSSLPSALHIGRRNNCHQSYLPYAA